MKKDKKLALNKSIVKDLNVQSKVKAGASDYSDRCGGGSAKTGNTGTENG
jgi:hypothetical protein